jgi:hypothetical protein
MSTELPHTIEMKKGLSMRLFLWTYRPDEDKLNTCWLLWGFLLILPAVLVASAVRVLATVFRPIGQWLNDKDREKEARRREYLDAVLRGEITPQEKKQGRFLPAVSNFFSTVWFKLAPVWPWVGRFLGLMVALIAAYLLIFVVDYSNFLEVLWGIAIALVMVLVAASVLYFLLWLLFEKWDVGRALKAGGKAFHNHTCANIRFKDE